MNIEPSVQGLDHLQIAMPKGEEAKAREFYRDLLGFREVAKPAALKDRGGVWFETPGLKLHLGVDPNFAPAGKAHPAFIVSDLCYFRTRLEIAGHDLVDDQVLLQGYRRLHTYDPFGNRIELMERLDSEIGN